MRADVFWNHRSWENLDAAIEKAYALFKISWTDMHYRKDIGRK